MATKTKIRWGDTLDDEDALPPTTIRGPDSHGVKTITEYFKNEKGDAIKKVTKLKEVKVEKKAYKVRMAAATGPCRWGRGCSHAHLRDTLILHHMLTDSLYRTPSTILTQWCLVIHR
jgi:hypothetical protein